MNKLGDGTWRLILDLGDTPNKSVICATGILYRSATKNAPIHGGARSEEHDGRQYPYQYQASMASF